LATENLSRADCILADLGVSSIQLDDPSRGFSMKFDGPLDMRMNPERGQPVSALLENIAPDALATLLAANADEPQAAIVAKALAGRSLTSTLALVRAIQTTLSRQSEDGRDRAVRRVFQALRIAVNDEFSALEAFLRSVPHCLNSGGRVCILAFHSGEDRRVKKSFEAALRAGTFSEISREVLRPSALERRANPRSASAKLRWARHS
jgi:16S rRNA (cytosine1402-N4)-methyltransferase